MVIARIEGIAARLDQFTEFHGLVRLVGVHGPVVEVAGAQPESHGHNDRQGQPAEEGSRGGTHCGQQRLFSAGSEAKKRADRVKCFVSRRCSSDYSWSVCSTAFTSLADFEHIAPL